VASNQQVGYRNKLFLVVIGIVSLLGFFIVSSLFEGQDVVIPVANIESQEYFLFLGLDDFGEVRRTDTIMVAKLEEDGVKVISIPRDLRVKFPDRSFHKINAAYGAPDGGIALVRRLVSDLLGVEVNAYLVADYQGVEDLVDAVNGVELNIESAMVYQDTKQGLEINLPAGRQILNGDQAVQFLRYRSDSLGDLGRIERQQEFLEAFGNKLSSPSSVDQVTKLISTAKQYVHTNLSALQFAKIAEKTRDFTPEDVSFQTLPGHTEMIDGIDYFIESRIEVSALVDEYFKGIERTTNSDVKVIVLDGRGGGTLGAQPVYEYLSNQSFDTIAYYHADALDYPRSFVVDLSGDEQKLNKLVDTLRSNVRSQWDEAEIDRRLKVTWAAEEGLSQIESQMEGMTFNQKADKLFELIFDVQSVSAFRTGFGAELAPDGTNDAGISIRHKPQRYDVVMNSEDWDVADRFDMMADLMMNFGDVEPNGAIDLNDADLVLIIGEGYPIE